MKEERVITANSIDAKGNETRRDKCVIRTPFHRCDKCCTQSDNAKLRQHSADEICVDNRFLLLC